MNPHVRRDTADAVVETLLDDLRSEATPDRAAREKRYLKSDLAFIGAGVPVIRRAATRVHRDRDGWTREELLTLVDRLWSRRIHELRMAAVELLALEAERLEPADTTVLEGLLRESRTWALVDPLAITVVGPLRDRFADAVHPVLAGWAKDADFWLRRAALLAYLRPLRRGEDVFDRWAELADPMLDEREFFIRKAIGWVLRETARKQPALVVEWLEPRRHRASGLTFREATRHLPEPEQRRLAALRP